MAYCPNCKAELSIHEKKSGKCLSCRAEFAPSPVEETDYFKNKIAQVLKICGIVIFVLGVIAALISSIQNPYGYGYTFSLSTFITVAASGFISGLMFLGFSEVIQLLEDIKSNLE